MSSPVLSWWYLLCAVSVLNVLLWSRAAATLRQNRFALSPENYAARRLQLMLSAVYVLGCAYRSVFPVFDVPRIVVVDSWLSSAMIGRSVATIAELCFMAQWVLLMREISRATRSPTGSVASWAVLVLIVMAEAWSWYSVLSTSNIGHVIEESLWALSAILVITSLVSLWPRFPASLRPLLAALYAGGVAYVLFMVFVDVPMYWSRWAVDEASGRHYLGLAQGVTDALSRRVVSHRWEDWKDEIAWMSFYFSVAVWLSIALVHAPAVAPSRKGSAEKP